MRSAHFALRAFLAAFTAFIALPNLTASAEPKTNASPTPAPVLASSSSSKSSPLNVTIGAYINDIHAINLATNSHYTDFYIWFRWQDEKSDPSANIDFMNWTNASDHTNDKQYNPPISQPNGARYTIIHHQGSFASKFSLENYPFDKQLLKIELEDSINSSENQVFIADAQAVKLDPVIHLPGYLLGTPRLVVTTNRYETNFGDLNSKANTTYSRATILIPVARPWVSGAIKVLLPIILILISAIMGLAIRPDHIDARVGLAITSLLTMVALQLTSSASLPEVSYLMLIDKVYLASYFVIVAVLGISVRDSWSIATRGSERVQRRNRHAIIALVLVYILFVAIMVGNALTA